MIEWMESFVRPRALKPWSSYEKWLIWVDLILDSPFFSFVFKRKKEKNGKCFWSTALNRSCSTGWDPLSLRIQFDDFACYGEKEREKRTSKRLNMKCTCASVIRNIIANKEVTVPVIPRHEYTYLQILNLSTMKFNGFFELSSNHTLKTK